jgi:DNA-binding winged helix-turn-helix (wHTH) protein
MTPEEKIVRFAPFEFDFKRKQLNRSGAHVRLSASQLSLLSLFLQRPTELVTHEQIMQHIWFDLSTADTPTSIDAAINHLRAHLGDDPAHPLYLETVPGIGYRFIAPLVPHSYAPMPPPSPEDLFSPETAVFDSATLLNLQSDPFLRASIPRRLSPIAIRYIGRRLTWITLTTLVVLLILYFLGPHLVHHFASHP